MRYNIRILLCLIICNVFTPFSANATNCNQTASNAYMDVNGIKMYYEVYGKGKPLVIIDGNGGSTKNLRQVLEFYCNDYQVILADSRGQGLSELNTNELTYSLMGEDWAALLSKLKIEKAHILGFSDGGVIGIKLAIHHPKLVEKLAIMGANTKAPEYSAYAWAINHEKRNASIIESKISAGDKSENWLLLRQLNNLLFSDPKISDEQLKAITAPVLVMAGDKDVIRSEHTLYIFEHLTNAHLAIFPGQTHFVATSDPIMFHSVVRKFFDSKFERPTTEAFFQ